MKRKISLALAFTLLLLTAAGCGAGDTKPSGGDTGTTAPEETTQSVESLLGFAKEDNGGKTFTMLINTSKSYEYDSEEATGDVVDDAVYYKNSAVEDYLGINLDFVIEDGAWNNRSAFNGLIQSDVMSGSKEYDYEIDAETGTILKSEIDIDD